MTVARHLTDRALDARMRWYRIARHAPLMRAACRTAETQAATLRAILRANRDTNFGRRFGFATITDIAAYRRRVPVQTYESLLPDIEAQQNGERSLTREMPLYYARTSGTTGRSKDIPLTRAGIAQVRDAQRLLAHALWRDTGFFDGRILGMASAPTEGHLANGVPYGAVSGQASHSLSPLLARKFAVPREAFSITDVEAKYRLYALAVLAAGDISGVVAANPSSLVKLHAVIAAEAPQLVAILCGDTMRALPPNAAELAAAIVAGATPGRAAALELALHRQGKLSAGDIWPSLVTVATWTGGSCGVALEHLRATLPARVSFVEYGYAASEFIGAATIDARAGICLPLVDRHVYEFVRRSERDTAAPEFLSLHELETGEDYHVLVTTRSGLYRYDINDIVRAVPGHGDCPGLCFVQKGRGVTNITGEKLSEHQLVAAVAEVLAEYGLQAVSYIALADASTAGYTLYLECGSAFDPAALARPLDDALCAHNSEYDDKRKSGRLAPLRVRQLGPGAGDAIKRVSLARGVREAQYKPQLLAAAEGWQSTLAPLIATDEIVS